MWYDTNISRSQLSNKMLTTLSILVPHGFFTLSLTEAQMQVGTAECPNFQR